MTLKDTTGLGGLLSDAIAATEGGRMAMERAKRAQPNPLAGVSPELDALIRAAGEPTARSADLSDGQRAVVIAALGSCLARFRAGKSAEGLELFDKTSGYLRATLRT